MPSLKHLLGLLLPAIGVVSHPTIIGSHSQADIDSGKVVGHLNQIARKASIDLLHSSTGSKCTLDTLKIRRECRNLKTGEKKDFIKAVQCLQTQPSLYPIDVVPGAKSIFDDFVAVHMNQTPYIHVSATFLTWHRYYIWTYEKLLNEKCGYKGTLPYWEWGHDIADVSTSPIFDGSDTSLGSDGAPISPHPPMLLQPPGFPDALTTISPGRGGGCVQSGPFANMTVHLGPQLLPMLGTPDTTGAPDPFADNPRCLRRDLSAYAAARWASFRNTTAVALDYDTVELFQAYLGGDPRYVGPGGGELGVHGGGHYAIGGDPGSDVATSPGDPAFYLHHGQIDRVYWMWQMLDFESRRGVWGTGTAFDQPPSANVTVDDYVQLLPLNGAVQIKDLMNVVGGTPLCYIYE